MEEIWKDIPNLSSVQNPNNSFDGMNLQEFLARPFLYPNYNINQVFPAAAAASNDVVLLTPQPNSSSGSARQRTAIPCAQNNIDRRNQQRLIKNRESAARSRDRKEAYTAHLERELETLKAENARLKEEQQLREEAQDLKKHTLNRSSSSPF